MEKLMKLLSGLLLTLAVTAPVQGQHVVSDPLTTSVVVGNTSSAEASEILYETVQKNIRNKTANILTAVSARTIMYANDHEARKADKKAFRKEGMLYKQLVNEVGYLVNAVADFSKTAAKNPHKLLFSTKAATKVLLRAEDLVKNAVVIGMNSQVPNPFRVDIERFKKGTDTTPAYKDDSERNSKEEDGKNLLLPDERIEIIREALNGLRRLRSAVYTATYKLDTDFNVRNILRVVSPMDARLYERNDFAFEVINDDLNKLNLF